MGNHIVSANLNVFNGILSGTMHFTPGLNIISGENGTLKSQLLQSLRNGSAVASEPSPSLRMQAISPKRNSERRATEQILQHFRQNNRTWEVNQNERTGANINVSGFDNYPSLADLYYLLFEHRCKDGNDRRVHMAAVASEFNGVIQAVFPQYCILATWDEVLGAPRIRMSKNSDVEFPIEALSMGEQEVLSLILSMSTGRDNVDVYLIDEPEVHLNWHLEDRLFCFFDDLCETYGKQAVVVTHSRTIFKPRFLAKAQFMSWGPDKRVTWGKQLTKSQRSRLAGDAIEIVALGDFSKVTVFVEDASHVDIVSAIADLIGSDINISRCGNSSNVKSLYQHHKNHGPWVNAYFMMDGDNQGNPFPGDQFFIHLPYYCIENIVIDPETLATISSRSKEQVQEVLVDILKRQRSAIFQKNKFFEFLADSLSAEHMTFERLMTFDASLITKDLFDKLGIGTLRDVLPQYLRAAQSNGRLNAIAPNQLLGLPRAPADEVTAPIENGEPGA